MEKMLSTHLRYAKDRRCLESDHEHRASVVWIFSPSDQTLKFNCYCKTGRGGVLKESACSTSESIVLPCPVLFVD